MGKKNHARNTSSIHLMKLLFKALISRKVTLICVDAAHYDFNLWDDNKAHKLAPAAILCS